MEQEERSCIICKQKKREGIKIYTQWICIACEHEIVQTDAKDPKYPFFIDRMKQIWYKRDA